METKKKKIIIFYGSFGGGHLSAAKALKAVLENNYNCYVELVDGLEYVAPILNKISVSFYNAISRNTPKLWGAFYNNANKDNSVTDIVLRQTLRWYRIRLYRIIKQVDPDQIICTHPFPAIMCAHIARKGKIQIPISNILTDFEPHGLWYVLPEYLKYFFVPTEEMKKALMEKNIKDSQIHVTGIPINPVFSNKLSEKEIEETLEEFQIPKDKKNFIFFGGGEFGLSNNINIEIFKTLTKKLPEFHFVCISGKNPELYSMFEKAIQEENIENTTLIKYTTNISKLMKVSSGIFSKPGGLTTSEALSQGLPMFMINPLPGQEVANQNYIENIGAGILINKENLNMLIDRLKTDENYLSRLSENAKKFGKPNAADNICKIIFDLK